MFKCTGVLDGVTFDRGLLVASCKLHPYTTLHLSVKHSKLPLRFVNQCTVPQLIIFCGGTCRVIWIVDESAICGVKLMWITWHVKSHDTLNHKWMDALSPYLKLCPLIRLSDFSLGSHKLWRRSDMTVWVYEWKSKRICRECVVKYAKG